MHGSLEEIECKNQIKELTVLIITVFTLKLQVGTCVFDYLRFLVGCVVNYGKLKKFRVWVQVPEYGSKFPSTSQL